MRQEIPVRQYDLCTTRSLLKGMWQEGRLQVTNKRVLFRLSGRNWSGRAQKSIEFTLDDVVGMEPFSLLQFLHITGKLNDLFQGFTDCIGSALLFSPWIKDTKSLIFPAALPMDGTSSTTRSAS